MEFFEPAVKINELNGFVDDFLAACRVSEQRRHVLNASFLGQFKLRIDGADVPKSKFVTKKNESILKYLLFNKNKNISKERLIELFWPDSDKKSGFASIRTAIYRIRKLFSECGVSDTRDAFLAESNGYLYIKHPEYIDSDAETFLYLDIKQKASFQDDERIILLKKMTDLYDGHLMDESDYEEWAFFEREEYKTIYFNAVSALASLYIRNSQNKNAENVLLKALSLDPCHEELNDLMIRNYILMNQPEHAYRFYTYYKEMLERELGLEPDGKISALLDDMSQES